MSKHHSCFTVYPDDCNYMQSTRNQKMMVHGGTMLLKMDRVAAECVRQHLYKTDCDSALTVGVDKLVFLFGAELGDIIHLYAEAVDFGVKRIGVKVTCFVEKWGGEQELMAEGMFYFCSTKDGKGHPHNLREKNG